MWRSLPFRLRVVISIIAFLVVYTAVSTQALLWWTDQSAVAYAFPFYQWWLYWWCCASDAATKGPLFGSAAFAAIAPPLLAWKALNPGAPSPPGSLRYRQPEEASPQPAARVSDDAHGHARWQTIEEMLETFPGPQEPHGGFVAGIACDPRLDRGRFRPRIKKTWGGAARGVPMIDPSLDTGSGHWIVIAGSGSYKTSSLIPNYFTWKSGMFTLDPSTEIAPMVTGIRQRMGHDVFVFAPGKRLGTNTIGWIDPRNPLAGTHVDSVVELVSGESTGDATHRHWKDLGKDIVACLILNMLWDRGGPPAGKTLAAMRASLAVGDSRLRRTLRAISLNSPSLRARQLAAQTCEMSSEPFTGAVMNATRDTAWLAEPAYADMVSRNDFDVKRITDGKTDIFLALPLASLDATPAVARCIIGAFLNSMIQADGSAEMAGFIIDEAARLGYMKPLETARDAGRKSGIRLGMLYQSEGQIEKQWGTRGKEDWFASASWRAYAAIKDLPTAREIAETLGDYPSLRQSESYDARGIFGLGRPRSVNLSSGPRRLLKADEIISDARPDSRIIVPYEGRAIWCGQPIYFIHPSFRNVGRNRFVRLRP